MALGFTAKAQRTQRCEGWIDANTYAHATRLSAAELACVATSPRPSPPGREGAPGDQADASRMLCASAVARKQEAGRCVRPFALPVNVMP